MGSPSPSTTSPCPSTGPGTSGWPSSATPTSGRARPTRADGFTPLALAAVARPTLQLGTAVVPVYTRGPGLLAMQAATMAELRPGSLRPRGGVVLRRHRRALERRRLRRALQARPRHRPLPASGPDRRQGGRGVRDLHRPRVPPRPARRRSRPRSTSPPCARACCAWPAGRPTAPSSTGSRPTTSAPRWPRSGRARRSWPGSSSVRPRTPSAARAVGRVGDRRLSQRRRLRRVPPVARPRPLLEEMWAAWAAGDRKAALAAIPDEVVDALVVHGSFDECRAHVAPLRRQRGDGPRPGPASRRGRPGHNGRGTGPVAD